MRLLIALLFWIALPVTGQWTSLATNVDGTQVYFVSSFQQTGSNQPGWGKLFIADQSGVRPILIRNRDIGGLPSNFYVTNAYDVIGVAVASELSRLAVVATGFAPFPVESVTSATFQTPRPAMTPLEQEKTFQGAAARVRTVNGFPPSRIHVWSLFLYQW
jgi:hypothetical protein